LALQARPPFWQRSILKYDYLFFVSKEDGTGEHYFSRTNSEHERYKELARKLKEKERLKSR